MLHNSVSGENSDIYLNGKSLHVQTEDWGATEKIFVSRIFHQGRVIKTFKLAYEKVKNVDHRPTKQAALVRFHQLVLEAVQKSTI